MFVCVVEIYKIHLFLHFSVCVYVRVRVYAVSQCPDEEIAARVHCAITLLPN